MAIQVAIIGGNFSAFAAAKAYFKQAHANKDVHLTVISRSSHAYFNCAAPRLVVEPKLLDDVVFPVEKSLKTNSNGAAFTFVLGNVEKVDLEAKLIEVKAENGVQTVSYDFLILASGSRSENGAFKLNGDYKESLGAVKDLNKNVLAAKSIAVFGGGPTGVELCGELGFNYGTEKEIVLYTGKEGPVFELGQSRSAAAASKLADLKVKVINKVRYTKLEEKDGKTTAHLDDGTTKEFDFVVSAVQYFPNSEFLPELVKDKNGYVITDDHLYVKGFNNVLAIGDILAKSPKTLVDLKFSQHSLLVNFIKKEVFKKDSNPKAYSPTTLTIMVPISKKGGVGKLFGFGAPNFLVSMVKGKDFMIPKAKDGF